MVTVTFLSGLCFWALWNSDLASDKSLLLLFLNLAIIFPLHLIGLFIIRKSLKTPVSKILILVYVIIVLGFFTYPFYGLLKLNLNKTEKQKKSDYNLIFIVSDSLRADALSCYGGEAKTPNICGLAQKGVFFENAYSNSSWTLPSAISLFTGNYPSVYVEIPKALSVRKKIEEAAKKNDENFFDTNVLIASGQFFNKVGEKEILLGDALKKWGYDLKEETTCSLPESLNPGDLNLFRGLEKMSGYASLPPQDISGVENNIGIKNLGEGHEKTYNILSYLLNAKGKNFYILNWINDPHEPYSPPEKFVKEINIDQSKLLKSPDFYSSYTRISDKAKLASLGPYEKDYLRQLYLKEVESVDERIGYILKALEQKGLRDKTIIVFTADHGEGFGEHGEFSHGHSYYNEVIHIPLIVAGPGIKEGLTIKRAVSQIDIMPTLGDVMGIDAFSSSQGKSFKSLLAGGEDAEKDRVQYIEGSSIGGGALIDDNYKLIVNKNSPFELYDLLKDPKELDNIFEKNQATANKMRKRIFQIRVESLEKNLLRGFN